MTWQTAGMAIGGLGLLLVGMGMMTDGLKLAAGAALRDILSSWTRTRRRGLAAGFLITALVQSSSAVTVAVIGFANAGLLKLEQAVWVIFGSNVGTTMTGWIVALVGFKLNVEALALPLVGAGMILRLSGEGRRFGAMGQAVVGFGLLFLGIGVLKESFDALGNNLVLPEMEDVGLKAILGFVAAGFALTTLMQSSSAAMVVALSAAEGGLIPLNAAAAVVIGTNLGTTTTAIISTWGATASAKRVAITHVAFNIVTATVAIAILTPMMALVAWLQQQLALPAAPATTLAIFHTAFNILGILLMWPLADRLVAFIAGRFQSQEERASLPQFLDQTTLGLPDIAAVALVNETWRVQKLASAGVLCAINSEDGDPSILSHDQHVAQHLTRAIGGFCGELNRRELPGKVAGSLPDLLRTSQQCTTILGMASEVIAAQREINSVKNERVSAALELFRTSLAQVASAVVDGKIRKKKVEGHENALREEYRELKRIAVHEGASGSMGVVQMDAALRYASISRRMVVGLLKASHRLAATERALRGDDDVDESRFEETRVSEVALHSEDLEAETTDWAK